MARLALPSRARLAAAAFPSAALGRADQEMILQDDPRVIHPQSEAALRETLTEIKQLGTDRVRVTVLWNLIAPNPRSEQRPSFDATDPRAYPPGVWDRYDRVVRIAAELDLGVLFTISAPGPAWSDQGRRGRDGHPAPRRRARSATSSQAVGRRYSGLVPRPRSVHRHRRQPGSPLPTLPGSPRPGARRRTPARLPRVDHWSLYNEPNFPGWLMPQFSRGRPGFAAPLPRPGGRRLGRPREVRPRRATPSCWARPRASPSPGKRSRFFPDSVTPTLRFVREMYCLSDRYRPLRGRAARARGCPATGAGRGRFRADHPGLFDAPGLGPPPLHAHARAHLEGPRAHRHRDRLDQPAGPHAWTARAAPGAASAARRCGSPSTATRPGPTPTGRCPTTGRRRWMSWGEFVAFRNPRVASFAQFLLRDDGPGAQPVRAAHGGAGSPGSPGCATASGGPKPALARVPRADLRQPHPPARAGPCACSAPSGRPPTTPGCRCRSSSARRGGWQVLRSAHRPRPARLRERPRARPRPGTGEAHLPGAGHHRARGEPRRGRPRRASAAGALAGGRDDPQDAVVAVAWGCRGRRGCW